MKLIVAGSRGIVDYDLVVQAIKAFEKEFGKVTQIISGGAKGADRLGEKYANEHSLTLVKFLADWNKYGKRAGYLRNEEMAKNADACLCIWDGESKGTKHMIDIAERYGLTTGVIIDAPVS